MAYIIYLTIFNTLLSYQSAGKNEFFMQTEPIVENALFNQVIQDLYMKLHLRVKKIEKDDFFNFFDEYFGDIVASDKNEMIHLIMNRLDELHSVFENAGILQHMIGLNDTQSSIYEIKRLLYDMTGFPHERLSNILLEGDIEVSKETDGFIKTFAYRVCYIASKKHKISTVEGMKYCDIYYALFKKLFGHLYFPQSLVHMGQAIVTYLSKLDQFKDFEIIEDLRQVLPSDLITVNDILTYVKRIVGTVRYNNDEEKLPKTRKQQHQIAQKRIKYQKKSQTTKSQLFKEFRPLRFMKANVKGKSINHSVNLPVIEEDSSYSSDMDSLGSQFSSDISDGIHCQSNAGCQTDTSDTE